MSMAQTTSVQEQYVQVEYGLQDIIVTPKQRYRRKGNPAVDLVKQVIAHKDSNQVKCAEYYTADTYHRMTFALDNFAPDFNKGIWRRLQGLEPYVDKTGETPSLLFSIREQVGHEYYQAQPRRERRQTDRERKFGFESVMSTQTLETNMRAVFTDVDIYDNTISLLFNRFVSPLSSTLAVSYYRYYIIDTLLLDGMPVIDLAFEPVSPETYSFTGHLYIRNDSSYQLVRYVMRMPAHNNINFVSDYTVEQDYRQLENGLWAPSRTLTSCRFFLVDRKKTMVARQLKQYTRFDFDNRPGKEQLTEPFLTKPVAVKDSTFLGGDTQFWEQCRPVPLTPSEELVVQLVDELKSNSRYSGMILAADVFTTDYIRTVSAKQLSESKWDFGPVFSTVSWNKLEGVRLRIGGQTTAKLNPHWFFSGYAAFGTTDLMPKYNATVLYSFRPKNYHQYEVLRDFISVSAQFDVEEPGLQTGLLDRDNILMSIPLRVIKDKKQAYVFRSRLTYLKEFENRFSVRAQFDYEYNTAAGAMRYDRLLWSDTETYTPVHALDKYGRNAFHAYELLAELRYTPGSNIPINRTGKETPLSLDRDAPVIALSHRIGYLDDRGLCTPDGIGGRGYIYNRTEITAEKRFWFSSFGHLDARLQAGYIWNRVPFTKLYFPPASTSILLGTNAFNLMQPMEFVFDAYAALYTTYYFKGWILNRIPGINRLKLRGVVSFSAIYGGLTKKNDPYLYGNDGLYALPEGTSPLGQLPYMEMTAGLENILQCIRIDYVRRLTYIDGLGPWGRNGVKISVRLAL